MRGWVRGTEEYLKAEYGYKLYLKNTTIIK